MNNLLGVIERELITENNSINILFTNTDHRNFLLLLKRLGHQILTYEDLYFGYKVPNIIICNDKVLSYSRVCSLSIQYHIPVIVVDHEPLNPIIDKSKIDMINNIPNSFKIAIDSEIYHSWNKIHDLVLDIKDSEKPTWNKILFEISKRTFIL